MSTHNILPTTLNTVFLDRDGVINQEPGPILTPEQFIFIPQSCEAVSLINQRGWQCIVVTNQSGFARGQLDKDKFDAICDKMNDGLSKAKAHIDDLFYCPHYPSWKEGMVRELCHTCKCRKPGTLLFDRASAQYQINPSQAVFIGDTTSDFEAAARWGMVSIGVKTGHAGKDGKCERTPNLWASDLYEAVNFLLNNYQ